MMRCPRCFKAAPTVEELQQGCVDKQTLGCPTPLAVVPGKDILLTCRADACEKTFAIPATAVTSRHIPPEVSCMRSPCEIVVLSAEKAKRK